MCFCCVQTSHIWRGDDCMCVFLHFPVHVYICGIPMSALFKLFCFFCLLNSENLRSQTNNSKYCLSCTIKPHQQKTKNSWLSANMHSYFKQDNVLVLVGAIVSAYHHPNYDGGAVDPSIPKYVCSKHMTISITISPSEVLTWYIVPYCISINQCGIQPRVTQVLCFFSQFLLVVCQLAGYF